MNETIKRDTAEMTELYAKFISMVPGSMLEQLQTEFVEFNREKGTLLMKTIMEPWMRNPGNVAFGGITSSVIDNAMGMLSSGLSKRRTPTISMSINYIRGVPVYQPLMVEAVCEKQGRQINFVRCRGYNESAPEKTLFTAEGSFIVA